MKLLPNFNQPPQLKKCLSFSICLAFIASLPACTTVQSMNPFSTPTVNASTIGLPTASRSVGQRLIDESIESTAKKNIFALYPVLKQAGRIDVDSYDNQVLLTGEVPDETTKIELEKIVASMYEVKKVHNRLRVGRKHTLSYTVHDGFITSKYSQKVLASKQVALSQIKIVTENGKVYVMGRVTADQQSHLEDLANQTPGVLELEFLTSIIPSVN